MKFADLKKALRDNGRNNVITDWHPVPLDGTESFWQWWQLPKQTRFNAEGGHCAYFVKEECRCKKTPAGNTWIQRDSEGKVVCYNQRWLDEADQSIFRAIWLYTGGTYNNIIYWNAETGSCFLRYSW